MDRRLLATHTLLALALSTLIGISLGLLGGGGSTLAVPVLVYVARIDPPAAIGMSLAVVGVTALAGALVHSRKRRVDHRAAALFGGAGMLGAPIGAQATHAVEPRILLMLFAGLMVTVGGLMLRRGRGVGHAPSSAVHVPSALGAGFGVGLLTGFLGVGGGFLIVPALRLFARLPIHTAVGTSLLVIALNCAAGLAGHVGRGAMPLGLTAAFTAAAATGAVAGVRLASGVDPARLQRAFGIFVILVGLAMLVRNALAP